MTPPGSPAPRGPHVVPAPVAHLRVYEPLTAFPDPERSAWAAYAAAGRSPARDRVVALEREAALRALVGLLPGLPDLPGHALVDELDGVTVVCPLQTRLRAQEALVEFRADLPDLVADAFVPRSVADDAEAELHRRRAEADLRVHVRSSTWQVPLRWFLLVEAQERQVSVGAAVGAAGAAPSRRTGRSLVYRTAMSQSRRRVARALAVLRRSLEDNRVTTGVEDLGRWLEEFHPRSLVELDYGGLVHLLDDEDLLADDSAADVAQALGALGDGRQDDAGRAYRRVTRRMASLQALESAG